MLVVGKILGMTLIHTVTPRFLIAKGRIQDARDSDILVYHRAGRDENAPLVEVEMKQIHLSLCQEAEKEKGGLTWSRVLWSPANRKRLLISAVTGIGSGMRRRGGRDDVWGGG
ncbi:hypothetical protein ASPCAL01865 [Aspergillus calidoustus]|uniref:Uncharacterized protein n=1 Tax=Aspergillus calidoustus TaxID=454130 RepID=A0A0U5GQW5_ASPCI|nr:hypothetical protein ASPCAL01865 [Aspergillus calidoustus]